MLVAGRYRLRGRLGREGESARWGADDEALRRPVMVWIFPPGLKRADAVVAAAQAACHLDDPRLVRVFDADARGEFPYVVTEWPPGWQLGELLAVSPAEPVSAAAVVAEAAGALAVAHAAGLAHLCLRPCSLWWGPAGGVKISGLGIAAAGAGMNSADPALTDTRGLGKLLYAALTGYWPGAELTSLPAAPRCGDRLYTPSQVRPGVPGEFDAVACRVLPLAGCHSGPPPLRDPAQLAGELAQAAGAYSLRYGLARLRLPGRAGQPAASPSWPRPLVAAPAVLSTPLKKPASVTMRPVTRGAASGTAARERRRGHAVKAAFMLMLMLAVALALGAGGWYLAHHGISG